MIRMDIVGIEDLVGATVTGDSDRERVLVKFFKDKLLHFSYWISSHPCSK